MWVEAALPGVVLDSKKHEGRLSDVRNSSKKGGTFILPSLKMQGNPVSILWVGLLHFFSGKALVSWTLHFEKLTFGRNHGGGWLSTGHWKFFLESSSLSARSRTDACRNGA